MNKETIYIEASDDITDILSKLKSSDKKIIALVPPKKPGVLLSSVNIKLIARTAKAEKKAVVLVTTDDSVTKLAMAAQLPVAPSLKSRPVMPATSEEPAPARRESPKEPEEKPAPAPEKEPKEPEEPEDSEEPDEPKESKESKKTSEDFSSDLEPSKLIDEIESEDSEPEEAPEKKPKPEKSKSERPKSDKPRKSGFAGWLAAHKAWVIFGSVGVVLVTAFLVWAFKFAPRVKIAVSVRTSSANFSENVSFTSTASEENAHEGLFYAHTETLDKEQTVKFTATGQKDMGEKATGNLVVGGYFKGSNGVLAIPSGSVFSYNGLEYVTTADVTLVGPSKLNASTLKSTCNNYTEEFDPESDYCVVSTTVSVQASAPGDKYNIASATDSQAWSSSISGAFGYNADAISGGTSKIVTTVLQSDVDAALDKLANETKDTGKNELLRRLSDTVLPIDASFKTTATEPKSEPAVGAEVPEGVTPAVSSKTSFSIMTVDLVRVEEFITERAKLEEGRKLYSVGNPFVEYFTEAGEGKYSAKLKTTYKSGPKISETEILEKVSGQKLGRIEPVLKDAFPGISSVSIDKSYFWVNSVPSDPNKVTINVEIEE